MGPKRVALPFSSCAQAIISRINLNGVQLNYYYNGLAAWGTVPSSCKGVLAGVESTGV